MHHQGGHLPFNMENFPPGQAKCCEMLEQYILRPIFSVSSTYPFFLRQKSSQWHCAMQFFLTTYISCISCPCRQYIQYMWCILLPVHDHQHALPIFHLRTSRIWYACHLHDKIYSYRIPCLWWYIQIVYKAYFKCIHNKRKKEKKRPNTVLLLPSISCAFIPYEMRWTVGKSNDEKSPLNPIQGEMAQKIIQKSLVHAVKYLYDLLTPPVRRVEFFCLSCSCIYVSLQHSSTQIIIIKSTQIASSNQIKS